MSNSSDAELDVFLRGDRDYVQGTQIIARAADGLLDPTWRFHRATFSRITTHRVRVLRDPEGADAIGEVVFRDATGAEHALGLVESPQPAMRRDAAMPPGIARVPGADDRRASYEFRNVSSFEDLLNAIVMAIKQEHGVLYEKPRNVWLTGMRAMDLPVTGPFPGDGRIDLSLMRRLQGVPACQTLWQLRVARADGAEIVRGAVTFSYEQGGAAHAD